MSYSSIAEAATSEALKQRIAACIAQERPDWGFPNAHPLVTAAQVIWLCCGEPGWGEAWDSAMANKPDPSESMDAAIAASQFDPGDDPAVITDGMILAAVQKHLVTPEPLPEG